MKTAILDKNTAKKSHKVSSSKKLDDILEKKATILNDILSRADLSTLHKSAK